MLDTVEPSRDRVSMAEALELTRQLSGPPATVFRIRTDPRLMRRWLFASETGTLIQVEADPVVDGRYSILEVIGGREIEHVGRYLAVDPPHLLRFTLHVPQHFAETTEITVAIEPLGDGSLLRFRQTGIDPDKTRSLWVDMLDQLAGSLSPADHPYRD